MGLLVSLGFLMWRKGEDIPMHFVYCDRVMLDKLLIFYSLLQEDSFLVPLRILSIRYLGLGDNHPARNSI